MFYFNFCWDFKCASEMYMQFQHFREIVHLSMFAETVVTENVGEGKEAALPVLYIFI